VNLNLAFIGSTGVGKSVSARAVLQAAQSGQWAAGQVGLVLRGEHFSAAGNADVEAMRKQVLQHVMEHLLASQGYGVVVLDEAQKMHPSVLSVLVPLMDSKGAPLVLPNAKGVLMQVPLKKLVVVVVCDVGHERMRALLGAGAGPVQLSAVLRQELQQQWASHGLAEVMHSIVPFLPLSPLRVKRVVGKYLSSLQGRWRLPLLGRGGAALLRPGSLQVQPAVQQYMTSMIRFSATRAHGSEGVDGPVAVFAQFGARQVHEHEDGPLRRLELLLHKHTKQLQDLAAGLLSKHSPESPAPVQVQVDVAPSWDEAALASSLWSAEPASAKDWRDFLATALKRELSLHVCVLVRGPVIVLPLGQVRQEETRTVCEAAWQGRLGSSL